ncbi:MAG: CcoQ/FixQ family Cbb3-type cytochrome c oxidase assembly chaperone [Ignavibacteriae bacterium HGW-Ignavibacteriae-2]|jgi:cbb3-type cytochrome oxidase subunit 3|nr:CcoQ/FixQ family Cbb3-type cytochrome c oxidase assembly chaperone [Bacteroidota bacterium]PKL87734.1 MAG: CcoQ/FixQ family Cbb3-type cytochrome c oxidase assembly chaperone [Ignavibacteriae bacterium HGW-Ignavibacteriae-2]
MFSNNLSSIEGVSVYAIISLIIFVTFFIGITIWVIKADKNYLNHMENLPLENDNQDITILESNK